MVHKDKKSFSKMVKEFKKGKEKFHCIIFEICYTLFLYKRLKKLKQV